jgi:hypothetical protein
MGSWNLITYYGLESYATEGGIIGESYLSVSSSPFFSESMHQVAVTVPPSTAGGAEDGPAAPAAADDEAGFGILGDGSL